MKEININPRLDTRAGRMLAAGRLKVTIKSLKSGKHLTVSFTSMKKMEGRWAHVPIDEASHVFIKEGRTKIANYYPPSKKAFTITRNDVLLFSMDQAVAFINGERTNPLAEIREGNNCGRCGRGLEDPISIERGIGPDCYGIVTGSQHLRVDTESAA
jgi:hypothetical protein